LEAIAIVYHARPETWNFQRAKTARIDDRKLVHTSNIDQFTIVDSSEFSRSSKSKFQAARGIVYERTAICFICRFARLTFPANARIFYAKSLSTCAKVSMSGHHRAVFESFFIENLWFNCLIFNEY